MVWKEGVKLRKNYQGKILQKWRRIVEKIQKCAKNRHEKNVQKINIIKIGI